MRIPESESPQPGDRRAEAGRIRLERLLARRPDLEPYGDDAGGLIRRGELLIAADDLPAAEDHVRRWYDGRDEHGPVVRIRLRPDVPARELAAETPGAAVNNVLQGAGIWWGGPEGPPRPAPPPRDAAPDTAPDAAPTGAAGLRTVTVAVLDTGIAPHPWWRGAGWYAAVPPEAADIPDADLDYRVDAQAGHGTFVAGLVLRAAPAARLVVARVLDADGVGDDLRLLRALAGPAGAADVLNMSFGGYTFDDRPSPLVARAIAALAGRRAVIAAAGNDACGRPYWPAALAPVVAVGALDGTGARAAFTNHGPWVDRYAPGTDVTSTFLDFDGPEPAVRGIDPDAFHGYATWSGTSFAAATVSGNIAAALFGPGDAADSGPDTQTRTDRLSDRKIGAELRTTPEGSG